jgi:hypothetical protein
VNANAAAYALLLLRYIGVKKIEWCNFSKVILKYYLSH